MKHTKWIAAAWLAAAAAAAAQGVQAADAGGLEPGLRLAWSFGAPQAETRPALSLGLYPNDLGWRRLWSDLGADELARVEKPAVLDLHVGEGSGLRLMGVPLSAQALGLNADGEGGGGMRFMRPALIVLAAGAAAALAIGAAGDAAEDNNPTDNNGNDGGDGDDTCVELDPVMNSCVGG